jgi:hypothetical protein
MSAISRKRQRSNPGGMGNAGVDCFVGARAVRKAGAASAQ